MGTLTAYLGSGISYSNSVITDPLFYSRTLHDYHLRSIAGRYNAGSWYLDSVHSPAIDYGDPTTSYTNEPAPNGGRVNTGAWGDTNQASKSSNGTIPEPEPPAPEVSYDTRIKNSTPSTNYGTATYLDVGNLVSSNSVYRSLIWFNQSTYTNSSNISHAELGLYWYYPYPPATRNEDTVVEVYRSSAIWDEEYATWIDRTSIFDWTTAGGTWFDKNGVSGGSTPYGTITIDADTPATNGYVYIDVTDLVKYYADHPTINLGMLIKAKDEHDNYIGFYSLDYANASMRPKLTITTGAAPPEILINSYQPVDVTPSCEVGSGIQRFNVTLNGAGNVDWYLNGTKMETDYGTFAEYNYNPTTIGSYNITALTSDDSQMWTLSVESSPTIVITDYSPLNVNVQLVEETNQTFTVDMNGEADISWYVEGALIETDLNTTSASFTWGEDAQPAVYYVSAIMEAGDDTDEVDWIVEVIPQSEEPTEHYYVETGYEGFYNKTFTITSSTQAVDLQDDYDSEYVKSMYFTIPSANNKNIIARNTDSWSTQWDDATDNPTNVPIGDSMITNITFNAYNSTSYSPSVVTEFTAADLTINQTKTSGHLNISTYLTTVYNSTNGTINIELVDSRYENMNVTSFYSNNPDCYLTKDGMDITITTGALAAGNSSYYLIGLQIPPLPGFDYWDGEMWYNGNELEYLYFDAFWWCNLCPNYGQTSAQPTLRITNVGGTEGIPYVWLNVTPANTTKIWVDNDNIKNGDSIQLSDTPQAVGTVLQPGENVTLWAWGGFYGAESQDYAIYAEVL